MEKTIMVLPGDGIGPEVTREAVRLLETVGERFGHTFHFEYAKLGGAAIDETGTPLPDETLQACLLNLPDLIPDGPSPLHVATQLSQCVRRYWLVLGRA